MRARRRGPVAERRAAVPLDQGPERVGLQVGERRRVAPEAGHATWRRSRERAAKQRVQTGQVDGAGFVGRKRPDQVRVRVAVARPRQQQARHPGHAAVQAARVRDADQSEHGQRLGHSALHRRHRHEAEGRQVFDHEGPQQADDPPLRHPGQHVRVGRRVRVRRRDRRRLQRFPDFVSVQYYQALIRTICNRIISRKVNVFN